MKKMKLNLLYASSNEYLPFAVISIMSILNHNKNIDFNIYFLHTNIIEERQRRLRNEIEQFTDSRSKIIFIQVNEYLEKFKTWKLKCYNGNYMNLMKVFPQSLFKEQDIERLVWIDCDTIVLGSLEHLIDYDTKGKAMLMVPDTMHYTYKKGIGLKKDDVYYNTGIILFDMKKWICEKCEKKLEAYIKNLETNYCFAEQDIVNLVLRNYIGKLNLMYNFISPIFMYNYKEILFCYNMTEKSYVSKVEYERAKKKAVIYHFAGDCFGRPWYKKSKHPKKNIYLEYLKRYNWFDFKLLSKTIPFQYRILQTIYEKCPSSVFIFGASVINWMIAWGCRLR